MHRTSVPEGEEGVKDRNGECAVKMCEILYLLEWLDSMVLKVLSNLNDSMILDSGTEPRVGLSQIPLYGVIVHSRER